MNDELLPPGEVCQEVNLDAQSVCLQEYTAARLYEQRTSDYAQFMDSAMPALSVVVVMLAALALAKWRR